MRETTKESSFERKFIPEEVTQDTSSLVIEDNSSDGFLNWCFDLGFWLVAMLKASIRLAERSICRTWIWKPQLAPAGPYARTATSANLDLDSLFSNDDQIFIYKQLVGQSKRFMYLLADEKPENYERPQNFEDGDFQVMNLATEESLDTVHKQFKISMCSYEGMGFI